MNDKIKVLTQVIRDCSDCDIDYGTLRTLKMIDDESARLKNENADLLEKLIKVLSDYNGTLDSEWGASVFDHNHDYYDDIFKLIEKLKNAPIRDLVS